MSKLIGKCPSCSYYSIIICGNCDKDDLWNVVHEEDDVFLKCHCDNMVGSVECDHCETIISAKFYSELSKDQLGEVFEEAKSNKNNSAFYENTLHFLNDNNFSTQEFDRCFKDLEKEDRIYGLIGFIFIVIIVCGLFYGAYTGYKWVKKGYDYEQVRSYWDEAKQTALADAVADGTGNFNSEKIYTNLFSLCRTRLQWDNDRCANSVLEIRTSIDEQNSDSK